MQNLEIPKQGARVILWDNARDQWRNTHYFNNPTEFGQALVAADASGKGYRIAYSGERTPNLFEWFCRLCWSLLDGRYHTYVLVEELGRVCHTSGRAMPQHERLVSEGRKNGLRYHATNQRTQEIPKTITGNCEVLWLGAQEPMDAFNSAKLLGVHVDELLALHELEFLVRDYQFRPKPQKFALSFKK